MLATGGSYALANVDGLTLDDVDAVIAAGGRFVVFEFAISIILLTYSRPSKAWLVRSEEEARRIARRYTIPTALFGWWGFPHGPIRTMHALGVNRRGGADVTKEVRAGLTPESLAEGIALFDDADVEPEYFMQIGAADLKDLRRCLAPVLARYREISAAWAARTIDDDVRPELRPFVIGLAVDGDLHPGFVDEAGTALRKVFRKWVEFDFVVLDDGDESAALRREGAGIYTRGT